MGSGKKRAKKQSKAGARKQENVEDPAGMKSKTLDEKIEAFKNFAASQASEESKGKFLKQYFRERKCQRSGAD